jgi:hypothetical protein
MTLAKNIFQALWDMTFPARYYYNQLLLSAVIGSGFRPCAVHSKRFCAVCARVHSTRTGRALFWFISGTIFFPIEHKLWNTAPGLRWVTQHWVESGGHH